MADERDLADGLGSSSAVGPHLVEEMASRCKWPDCVFKAHVSDTLFCLLPRADMDVVSIWPQDPFAPAWLTITFHSSTHDHRKPSTYLFVSRVYIHRYFSLRNLQVVCVCRPSRSFKHERCSEGKQAGLGCRRQCTV